MHHNKLLHFKYSLYNSKTDPASISKRRASRIPPVPQVSTAQVESGLYFLITNKLNARRWVKTFSLKMVGICICHQSVSVKLSFWLRKLREEEKKKPKPKKVQERKKSSPQTLATFKTREELNSVDRDASLEAVCLQRGWALICLSCEYAQNRRTDSEWEKNTESNCESIRKTRTIEEVMQPWMKAKKFSYAECWLKRGIRNTEGKSHLLFKPSLYFHIANNYLHVNNFCVIVLLCDIFYNF